MCFFDGGFFGSCGKCGQPCAKQTDCLTTGWFNDVRLRLVRGSERGWVVLASDATHFYANMETMRPYPVVVNVAEMVEGFKTIQKLATSANHVIPGHDPLVLSRYPAAATGLEGIAARLDADIIL